LDLAGEQLAGAAMAEISSVLYSKVMQWAGYSKDRKVATYSIISCFKSSSSVVL